MYKLSILVLFLSLPCVANIGIFMGGGQVTGKLATQSSRHGLLWQFDQRWLQDTNNNNNYLNLQIELAASHWNNQYFPDIKVISLTPVFHYYWRFEKFKWYAGLGIGAAKLSSHYLSSRNLGSKWLFEDKLVTGVKFDKHHAIDLSLNHYSNADLASGNDGSTFVYINYSYIW